MTWDVLSIGKFLLVLEKHLVLIFDDITSILSGTLPYWAACKKQNKTKTYFSYVFPHVSLISVFCSFCCCCCCLVRFFEVLGSHFSILFFLLLLLLFGLVF
jgi:Na+/H+-dicarboxylate symporter